MGTQHYQLIQWINGLLNHIIVALARMKPNILGKASNKMGNRLAKDFPQTLSRENCVEVINVALPQSSAQFWCRFIAVDEILSHRNIPENKQYSNKQISLGKSKTNKTAVYLSSDKVMAPALWNTRGIIHIDYIRKGETFIGKYWANLLGCFNDNLKEKGPHLAKNNYF